MDAELLPTRKSSAFAGYKRLGSFGIMTNGIGTGGVFLLTHENEALACHLTVAPCSAHTDMRN
jgi:hypothetical protein